MISSLKLYYSNISFTNTPGNHIHCIYSTETLIDTVENVYHNEDVQESGIENLCQEKGATSTEPDHFFTDSKLAVCLNI